jgi:Ser/Thr protein kinase RdoA (MazF antagonist)
MNSIVKNALCRWGMSDADFHLIAARENSVYRVDHDGLSYALRVHRRGYRSDAELWSELQWMQAISHGGIDVPAPVASTSGQFLHVVDGVHVDVLNWLPGAPLGSTFEVLKAADRTGLFRRIGCQMARLHRISDAWVRPEGFNRCVWDRGGLLGEAPLWGRFWENPTLGVEDRALFTRVRETANYALAGRETALDYGLIHADLVRENIIIDGDRLQFIDFDDGGFGFRLFDLATALIKNLGERDYPALRDALISGYREVRAIDIEALELFVLLRSATYVGWIIERMEEPGADRRNASFITTTRHLAQAYLGR